MDFSTLAAAADRLDALVAATLEVDHFCSSSAWALPAQAAFMPDAVPFITEGPAGIIALMVVQLPDGRRAGVPLEASWGLACPLLGPDARGLVIQLTEMMRHPQAPDTLYLSGITHDGPIFETTLRTFMGRARFGLGRPCGRRVADISDGVDAWLATRSARFRANQRRARRRAYDAGYRFEWRADVGPGEIGALFDTLMALEARSWKGQEQVGVNEGEPRLFYRLVSERLAARGALRVLMGERDGDLAVFVLGGVFGDTFRGLQMSFDDAHRPMGLGNVGQLETMLALEAEGITRYDLGTEMPYKARWAPPGLETITLAVFMDD